MHLLANGGMLPQYQLPTAEKTISPRRKGVKQGALLVLIGALLVPVLGVMANFAPGRLENVFEFFCALAALVCFLGGPLRMLFAAIFEEGAPQVRYPLPTSYNAPVITPAARAAVLPPASINPITARAARPETAEIFQPPSVTDGTTRLLDKQEPEGD